MSASLRKPLILTLALAFSLAACAPSSAPKNDAQKDGKKNIEAKLSNNQKKNGKTPKTQKQTKHQKQQPQLQDDAQEQPFTFDPPFPTDGYTAPSNPQPNTQCRNVPIDYCAGSGLRCRGVCIEQWFSPTDGPDYSCATSELSYLTTYCYWKE